MRTQKTKKLKPFGRKIHLGDAVWTYRIPGDEVVQIRNPELTRTFRVRISSVAGVTPMEVERARHKRTDIANVTPAMVKKYIEKHLIGE